MQDSKGSCDFEPMIALIGIAIAAFVHSCCVALFAWTPLSAPLRSSSQVSQPTCLFNAFLHASMVFDAAAYGYALYVTSISMTQRYLPDNSVIKNIY